MSNVVSFDTHREASLDSAWAVYCEAMRRAQNTLSVSDGIAAGHAWRRWLDLFMSSQQRTSLEVAILPSERR
jgi:hypothetical protein